MYNCHSYHCTVFCVITVHEKTIKSSCNLYICLLSEKRLQPLDSRRFTKTFKKTKHKTLINKSLLSKCYSYHHVKHSPLQSHLFMHSHGREGGYLGGEDCMLTSFLTLALLFKVVRHVHCFKFEKKINFVLLSILKRWWKRCCLRFLLTLKLIKCSYVTFVIS